MRRVAKMNGRRTSAAKKRQLEQLHSERRKASATQQRRRLWALTPARLRAPMFTSMDIYEMASWAPVYVEFHLMHASNTNNNTRVQIDICAQRS